MRKSGSNDGVAEWGGKEGWDDLKSSLQEDLNMFHPTDCGSIKNSGRKSRPSFCLHPKVAYVARKQRTLKIAYAFPALKDLKL